LTLSPEVRAVAQILLNQLRHGTKGCRDFAHRFAEAAHYTTSPGNHNSLEATYQGISSFPGSVGFGAKHLRSNQGANRTFFPPEEVFSRLFTGSETTSGEVPRICLHAETASPSLPEASFDIDSIIGFPSSLEVLREGFHYCPTLLHTRKIVSNLHLEKTISFETDDGTLRSRTLPLRHIPHLYLGTVLGIHDCSLYIFFPALFSPDHAFEGISDDQMHRFTDHLMLASIRRFSPNSILQHIPVGFEVGKYNSEAKGHEMRTGLQESTSRTHRGYTIQAEHLADIWNDLLGKCTQTNFSEFATPFLGIMSKGHKLQFTSRESLPDAVTRFYTKLESMLDLTFLHPDELYLDLALEICPNFTDPPTGPRNRESEPQVYLWRRCCLEHQLEALYGRVGEEPSGVHTFYQVKFLHEACNLTSVPAKTSHLWHGGLRYSQHYAVEKEVSDAGTIYPFSNPGLEELCLDPQVWENAASAAKWKGKRSRSTIADAYSTSKDRVKCSYDDNRHTSFGVRVEYRVSSTLLHALAHLASAEPKPFLPRWEARPECVWAIRTDSFADYVLGNIQKFCVAIETVLFTSPREGVGQQQSYVLYSLLKCLRYFFSRSNLQVQPTLWYDQREVRGALKCGLGFESTLAQTGYCWFLPVVNWTRFAFLDTISPHLVINDKDILGVNLRAQRAREASWNLDIVLEKLRGLIGHPEKEQALLLLLCHLCLQRFRRDLLEALAKDTVLPDRDYISLMDRDAVNFSYTALAELFVNPPVLIYQNRAKVKYLHQIFDVFWGTDKAYCRKHWESKPFRHMFFKVSQALQVLPVLRGTWLPLFTREFYTYHWVLPKPDWNGSLISTTKEGGKRAWWSIVQQDSGFALGRQKYRRGEVPSFPPTLSMSPSELDRYLLQFDTQG